MDDIQSSNGNGNYSILREDVEGLYKLINKYVKVQLIKETEFSGFVHSIDPVQYSIILLLPQEDSYAVNIIPGHAILDVAEIDPGPKFKPPQRKVTTVTSLDIIKKKERLMSWFKRNLLPITESEKNILFGNVSILPPYDVSNICTDNPVVAMQVRKIIENMPHDFDSNK